MTLQNRVNPAGQFHAVSARGTLMGNRGGRLHDPATKQLQNRQWVNKAWIICLTQFKTRQRSVMGKGYTELFFLDEVTALAAGHRPCFECRRSAAKAFQAALQKAEGLKEPPKVGVIDPLLHAQRTEGRNKRLHQISKADLNDGAIIEHNNQYLAMKEGHFLRWDFSGYQLSHVRMNDLPNSCTLLTPPAILKTLRAGYQPQWHSSAC